MVCCKTCPDRQRSQSRLNSIVDIIDERVFITSWPSGCSPRGNKLLGSVNAQDLANDITSEERHFGSHFSFHLHVPKDEILTFVKEFEHSSRYTHLGRVTTPHRDLGFVCQDIEEIGSTRHKLTIESESGGVDGGVFATVNRGIVSRDGSGGGSGLGLEHRCGSARLRSRSARAQRRARGRDAVFFVKPCAMCIYHGLEVKRLASGPSPWDQSWIMKGLTLGKV